MNKLTKNKYQAWKWNKAIVSDKNATKTAKHLLFFKFIGIFQKIILKKPQKMTFFWVFNNETLKLKIYLIFNDNFMKS